MVLNKKQKECLIHLTNIYRYYYNKSISYINNYDKETKKTFFNIYPKDEKSKIEINLTNIKFIYLHN